MAMSISGKSVLGIVLAGGAGTRLSPLTADRAKPAVPLWPPDREDRFLELRPRHSRRRPELGSGGDRQRLIRGTPSLR